MSVRVKENNINKLLAGNEEIIHDVTTIDNARSTISTNALDGSVIKTSFDTLDSTLDGITTPTIPNTKIQKSNTYARKGDIDEVVNGAENNKTNLYNHANAMYDLIKNKSNNTYNTTSGVIVSNGDSPYIDDVRASTYSVTPYYGGNACFVGKGGFECSLISSSNTTSEVDSFIININNLGSKANEGDRLSLYFTEDLISSPLVINYISLDGKRTPIKVRDVRSKNPVYWRGQKYAQTQTSSNMVFAQDPKGYCWYNRNGMYSSWNTYCGGSGSSALLDESILLVVATATNNWRYSIMKPTDISRSSTLAKNTNLLVQKGTMIDLEYHKEGSDYYWLIVGDPITIRRSWYLYDGVNSSGTSMASTYSWTSVIPTAFQTITASGYTEFHGNISWLCGSNLSNMGMTDSYPCYLYLPFEPDPNLCIPFIGIYGQGTAITGARYYGTLYGSTSGSGTLSSAQTWDTGNSGFNVNRLRICSANYSVGVQFMVKGYTKNYNI